MEQLTVLKTAVENPDSESDLTEHMLMKTMETLSTGIGKAMIFVQENGTVGACNQSMKELLGIIFPNDRSHEKGRLEKGDIIIIADNEIGNDDKMQPCDLEKLNIFDKSISSGDVLLAVGAYKDPRKKPVYKVFNGNETEHRMVLTEKYSNHDISAAVDFDSNVASITVHGESYVMVFQESVGNMVVLDGKDGHVKFYQEFGYDLRGEEIGELLRGHSFVAKNSIKDDADSYMKGKHLEHIIYGDAFLEAVHRIHMEPDGTVNEGVYDINRVLMFCRMVRVKNGGCFDGIHIFFQTSENMKVLQSYGASIVSELERRRKMKYPLEIRKLEAELKEYIGSAPAMASVKHLAYKASQHRFNVVITGESGTGKSRLAREIHKMQYGDAPFIEVTCNAIAPTLIESELFGYVPGAFTGAAPGGKSGFFEEANGGTIFLDEIGELPPDIQIKLLDVLQNKRIYRVGSTKPIQIDVRVITATNKDLKEQVANGIFRQDLYYRINVFPIHIPPLRQRKQDLGTLINSVLNTACVRYNVKPKQISYEALQTMMNYSWPGNVRELENVIERALTLCEGNIIYREHLILEEDSKLCGTMKERLAAEERRILAESLEKHGGDLKKVMEELNLTKSVLYGRLKVFNLK